MKKKYQLSFQKIRRKTQIKDITYFEIYLKNIFSNLAKRNWKNKEINGIEKMTFINYMNLPFIVGEKLFNVFDKNKHNFLSQTEFVSGIINLYVGGLEETQKIIFKILDFDFDGKIIPEDSRLLISFIKNLSKPPLKYMKVKPRDAPTDEENLEEINLIINNFFNNKNELSFEEYKYNIENVNSDVFFLFICFLYNNKPFNDSSIKILKSLNKNNTNFISSASSNYISCSSDDCGNDSKYKIRSPSKAFKSFVSELVDLDLDEIQRDCAHNSVDELDNIDEGIDNDLINEGYKSVYLPQFKPTINLNKLKAYKDYLLNGESNKSFLPTSRIKKTYQNYIERLNEYGNNYINENKESNSKLHIKISERKNYSEEVYDIEENNIVNEVKMPQNKSIGLNCINECNKKLKDNNNKNRIFEIAKSKIIKSASIKPIRENLVNSFKNIILTNDTSNLQIDNFLHKNKTNEKFSIIEIYDGKSQDCKQTLDNNTASKINYYDLINHNNNNEKLNSELKQTEGLNSNILNPNKYEGLNSDYLTNKDKNNSEEVLFTDAIYENYIYRSGNNDELKKYYMTLIGMDLFFFASSDKKKLRGMHNLSGTYIYEDENVIKVTNQIDKDEERSEQGANIFYAFKLYFSKKPRIYYCPTESEAKAWVHHIRNMTKFRLVDDYYDFSDDLGSGKFGKVKLAFDKNTKKKVAIKTIEKNKLKGTEIEMVKTEIEIMKFCKHKNIVELIDHFEDMDNIYIVLEYLSGGNLNAFLSKQHKLLSEERVKTLIYEMASAIAYLHNLGIVHRDLKPENTMMTDFSDLAYVKIVDFGLSKILGKNEKSNESYGTLSYAAPEVIMRNDYNNKIDIWSLGVVVYFLISGYLPFQNKKNDYSKISEDIIKKQVIFDPNIWGRVTNHAKDLVMKCLERDIDKRLNIIDFLQHEWMKK